MTATVDTATGSIPVSELGRTLMHEHVFTVSLEVQHAGFASHWDEDERVGVAVERIQALKASGIDTLVDCTVPGLGRLAPVVGRIAEQVDVNIILATGLYTPQAIPMYFSLRGPGTMLGGPEPMVEMFRRDLVEGIGDSGIKAAFLKVVVESRTPSPELQRPVLAAAEVSAELGTPIQVHTNVADQTGLTAMELLSSRGVDLSRVVIGHSGDSNDLEYLQRILDSGAIVGCDRFGLDFFNSTEQRVATIAELVSRGYASQIVLSHDASTFNDSYPDAASQAALTAIVPDYRYTFIPEVVLPRLRELGVSDDDIDQMLVRTPSRFFSGS